MFYFWIKLCEINFPEHKQKNNKLDIEVNGVGEEHRRGLHLDELFEGVVQAGQEIGGFFQSEGLDLIVEIDVILEQHVVGVGHQDQQVRPIETVRVFGPKLNRLLPTSFGLTPTILPVLALFLSFLFQI
jgi:hypothetical protein